MFLSGIGAENFVQDGSSWIDCSDLTVTGRQINPDIKALLQMDIEIFNCRYVIVVEKDAIFQQLLELRIFEKLPSVIITGLGEKRLKASPHQD